MADAETFCNCDYEAGDGRACICMARLPEGIVQRPCAACRFGKHELKAPLRVGGSPV